VRRNIVGTNTDPEPDPSLIPDDIGGNLGRVIDYAEPLGRANSATIADLASGNTYDDWRTSSSSSSSQSQQAADAEPAPQSGRRELAPGVWWDWWDKNYSKRKGWQQGSVQWTPKGTA
jgi:hypothetical protein